MIKLSKVLIILGILGLLLGVPSVAHADLTLPDTTELETVRCWRHMLEADDLLMVARYNVHYGNLTAQPYQPINETFYFTYTMGNSTLAGNVTAYPFFNLGYAKGLVAFYWEADDENKPAWGDLGTVDMEGTALFGGSPPSDSLALTSSDWVSATQPSSIREDLRQWLLNALIFMELNWNNWYADQGYTNRQTELVMIMQVSYNVASPTGEAYLVYTIDDITSIAPLLFMYQAIQPEHEEREWTLSQQINLEELHEGDVVGNATETFGNLMGGVGRIWASTLIILVGGLGIIIACQTFWQKMNCGLLIAYVLILLATPEGLFQMGLMALFALLAILQISYTLFWRRSAG